MIYSVYPISFLPMRESTLLMRTWFMLSFVILSNLCSKNGKMGKGLLKKTSVDLQRCLQTETQDQLRVTWSCACTHTVDVGT